MALNITMDQLCNMLDAFARRGIDVVDTIDGATFEYLGHSRKGKIYFVIPYTKENMQIIDNVHVWGDREWTEVRPGKPSSAPEYGIPVMSIEFKDTPDDKDIS